MDEFNQELLEDTMLENESNFNEYAKIYSEFKDDFDAVNSIENEDIKDIMISKLQQKYMLAFNKYAKGNDQALIDTYIDILGELGVSNYYLDSIVQNNGVKSK